MIVLEHTTAESLRVTITARVDPTASDVEFNLTASTETTPGATWTAGTWDVAGWNATTGKVDALSPILNATNYELTEGSAFKLWVRWTQGAETPVHLAETIRAT